MQKLKNFTLPSFASSSSSATENTSPPLDPDTLTSLDARRTVLSALLASLTVYHSTAAKLRPDPQRSLGGTTETALPVQWVGKEMLAGEEQLEALDSVPEGFEAYARTLKLIGEAQLEVGQLNQALLDTVGTSVLQELEHTVRDFKDFERKYKEAEKLRASLESKIAKKEKKSSDAEAERVAELDYNDACDSLDRLARSLLTGIDKDKQVLEDLLDAQLEHATKQADLLRECRAALSSSKPALPPRSSATLGLPRATTRMARSHSDSVVRPERQSSSPSPASHSPNLSGASTPSLRRSTIGTSSADKSKGSRPAIPDALKAQSRSRSSSMLGRFSPSVIRGKKKEKTNGAQEGEDDDDEDAYRHEESEPEVLDEPSAAVTTSPSSRFSGALPTLSSFKNLSLSNGYSSTKYDSLADDASSRNSSSPSTSSPRRAVPPALKRHQTAPSPRTSSSADRDAPKFVEARWQFATTDSGELALEKGDLVRVDEEINAEWMAGEIVTTSDGNERRVGRRGMFPTAFVAPSISALTSGSYDFSQPSRRSQEQDRGDSWSMSAASTTDESAGELSEDEEAKEGLREAGGKSGSGTPRKAPPPPPARRRTGTVGATASPFAD
ncbi:hypothetical protein BCR35DRAFT_351572 [Leucosporidium creatinivorum]|uniref:SH3 domain-containing protein n=1 Tax=Leucosporidium creatinivorum TaxID=106004 RepID=A0A1Y2FR11_9BASI|nr:hypothetical protein BCR35DRAFT_351572 [Leucosporidium creatinivorum]